MDCEVVIGCEEDTGAGWAFGVVVRCDGIERDHRARMSWVDYDYWCGGSVAPADVVRMALEEALRTIKRADLPASFDLSTLRRRCPGLDDALGARLGRAGAALRAAAAREDQARH